MKKPMQHVEIPEAEFLPLLASARAGEREALDRLFAGFYQPVATMVHARLAKDQRIGRPWLIARFSTGDVVQDVFQDLLSDLRTFRGATTGAFRAYLAMMVRNRLIDAIRFHEAAQRDGRRTTRPEDLERTASTTDPLHAAQRAEQRAHYEQALTTFSDREQVLLKGRLEFSEPFQSLADQLGYPSSDAAKRAFYLAKARLVMALRKEDPEGDA